MKRAVSPWQLGFLAALVNAGLTMPAQADCAADIAALRSQAAAVKDDHRRQELAKLIEKAEKDDQAGRAQLCADDVQHARALLK